MSDETEHKKEWLSVSDVSKILGLKSRTINSWLVGQKMPGTKLAGKWLIPADDFNQWVEDRTNKKANWHKEVPKDIKPNEWFTPTEVANMLAVQEQVVNRWLREDLIPGYKFGGTWRIDKTEFHTWVASQRNENKL